MSEFLQRSEKQRASKSAADAGGGAALMVDNRAQAHQLAQMKAAIEGAGAPAQLQEEEEQPPPQAKFDTAQLQEEEEQPPPQAKLATAQLQEEEEQPPPQAKLVTAQLQEEEEQPPPQAKLATAQLQEEEEQPPPQAKLAQLKEAESARPNNTGMPDHVKSNIESMSGMSMDDAKVHYNSDKPAQLNALAYAQGKDIHIASGQEQHLGHEAWHLVQQAQGRVEPTRQLKEGVAINDDAGLEHEADVMGAAAMRMTNR